MKLLQVLFLGAVILTQLSDSLPLSEDLTCLDGAVDSSGDCYHTFDEVMLDMGVFGQSIGDLASASNAGENVETDAPEPSKKLTLEVLESAVQQKANFVESPLGYLTKYGYVKGILAATLACGAEKVVGSDSLYASMVTFQTVQKVTEREVWGAMNRTRCSNPDITFDQEGNLDAESVDIIFTALNSSEKEKLQDIVGEMRSKIEEKNKQRKRRQTATDPPKTTLDLSEKTEYTYKLSSNVPSGLRFADDSVAEAFLSWSQAIGSDLIFTRSESSRADVKLTFEPDAHDDYTFSGDELAHAPFPSSEYHGKVHYRRNRDWDTNSVNRVDFLYVTVHELGHYLGLKHSMTDGSVMNSILDSTTIPTDYDGSLHDSDVLTVKLLYANAAPSKCPSDWHGFEGVCYVARTVSSKVTWEQARLACENEGAMLATVRNGPLNEYILGTVANGRSPYWIGRKSTDDGWVSGDPWDWYPELNKPRQMNPSEERCLKATAYSGQAKWEFVKCNNSKAKSEFFVCQKDEAEFEEATTPTPTQLPVTEEDGGGSSGGDQTVPCQNYIRGAVRRGNYLYIFGTKLYFKYYYTNKRPTLQTGYPKNIADNFEGVPVSFTAVVTDPYTRKTIFFIEGDEVYEWLVQGKRSSIESGKLKARGTKSGKYKPKKLKKLFKTSNTIRGATVFDRNSIMLFARSEVGRWHREEQAGSNKMISKYEAVEKWDYLDDMGAGSIDAVTSSYFDGFIMFIRDDEYFLVKRSDGKIPKRFRRNLSADFDKLEICDVIAPLTDDYPDLVDPAQELE